MHISVIICTWNRADLLERTLARLTEMKGPAGPWELILVDNNCTDHTQEVIARFRERLPMTAIREAEPGLSNARNAGLSVAKGEYVVWTDDDVLVDPEWLRGYESAFRRYPEATFFGGPIHPFMDVEPPAWFDSALEKAGGRFAWALRDLGNEEIPLGPGLLPFGANMAFKRSVLGPRPFDARLGRKEGQLLSGEETMIMKSLLEDGHSGRWIPGATVEHFVPADRMTLDYLRRWWVGRGRTQAEVERLEGRFRLLGVPGWVLREYIQGTVREQYHRLRGDTDRMLPHMSESARLRGLMKAIRAGRDT